MMILSIFFIETETVKVNEPVMIQATSGEISLGQFTDTNTAIVDPSFAIDTDFWIGFFGFWVAIIGFALTSKNITKKNERFGEKVTKIRV